jgi:hypothetical protein
MAKLTPEELKSRLKFDYLVAMKMRSPVMNVTAYRNADDLQKRRNPITSEEVGQFATHYLVDYFIRTLVEADRYSEKTSIMFDLLADGNYPYTVPNRIVISSPLPWSPHFAEGRPVCVDEDMWIEARGKMLLGDLLIHIAKLLNFDEIPREPNYDGYNRKAIEYWRTRMNCKPINPELAYPQLPTYLINHFRDVNIDAFASTVIPSDLFEALPIPSSHLLPDEMFSPLEQGFFEPDAEFFYGQAPAAPNPMPQTSNSLFDPVFDGDVQTGQQGKNSEAEPNVATEFFPKPNQ